MKDQFYYYCIPIQFSKAKLVNNEAKKKKWVSSTTYQHNIIIIISTYTK
jgi:hypothetical protein